jgi:hypothetical protein
VSAKIEHKIINNVEYKCCSKCKHWLSLVNFYKDKYTLDRFRGHCKNCCRQYRIENKEQRKQYYQKNKKQVKQYNISNTEKIREYDKQYRNTYALYKTYNKQLQQYENIRKCPENTKLLEVKCSYCGKWYKPANSQVRDRIRAFNGQLRGECRFYCSENCKQACPIYNQSKYPKGFKQATSREVVPLLRQLVLERDNYACQKCGATTETAQLHVHHILSYMLNKIMANDPDNCITLCKSCHKEIHKQNGCKYSDLKCKN